MSEQSAAWEYKEESPLREAWKMYLQNRAAVLGLVLLGAVLLLTCVGPLVYPVDPFEMVAPPMSAPGEYGLICGSDYLGRDIFAGIIAGGKATMAVGGFATLVTLCIGITIGALAGYRQGIWDELLMRATEFFQVLPPLLLAMVVVALFSPSLTSVAVSIGIVSWPQVARVTRAEFMRIKEMDYVAAARTMGAGNATIMCRVILPNAIPPLVIVATLTISSAILFESGLSFLGPRRPQHHDMGYDHWLQQGLHHEFLVGGHVPRPGHFPCGTCHRADRRRHQRCVQPPPAATLARPANRFRNEANHGRYVA